jgi:O-antigen/teichoic acid export membrane protein
MESRLTFFRQSGWLVVATVGSGVFMTATQIVASRWMEPGEYGLWFALLRIYLLMSIPSAGLQILFAQLTAAAVSPRQQRQLARTIRTTLEVTFAIWLLIAFVAIGGTSYWMGLLKISRPAAWHFTLAIGLASLWSPLVRGVLQGQQNFLGLGWVLILDGFGRFILVWIILAHGGQSAGGMAGALIGTGLAIGVGGWLLRGLLFGPGEPVDWRPWLRKIVPLTVAIGGVQFMMIVDVPYVQSVFPAVRTATGYMPAAMIGLALITLLLPMTAVMFPKIVRSAALTQHTRALEHAFVATALLGAVAGCACILFPKLPLQIIYFGKPEFWVAAPMVPWFTWCLLPLILANVLIASLLARERFSIAYPVGAIALAYGITLLLVKPWLLSLEPTVAFRAVLQILGGYSVLLLLAAGWFTIRRPAPAVALAP